MGTRNLTIVISNGKTKVAQYGQWDGYPEGQGQTILKFLREVNLKEFKASIDKLKWLTKKECTLLDKDEDTYTKHPYLSRDCGGQILGAIHYGTMNVSEGLGKRKDIKVNVLGLIDSTNFVNDSLFCEWAYVVDLDKGTFEVYRGFNQSQLAETERFAPNQKSDDGYYPVKLFKTHKLSKLPTVKEFIKIGKEEVETE